MYIELFWYILICYITRLLDALIGWGTHWRPRRLGSIAWSNRNKSPNLMVRGGPPYGSNVATEPNLPFRCSARKNWKQSDKKQRTVSGSCNYFCRINSWTNVFLQRQLSQLSLLSPAIFNCVTLVRRQGLRRSVEWWRKRPLLHPFCGGHCVLDTLS